MSEQEQCLHEIIFSGALQEIKFYNVNELFFELQELGYWIIDAGVQLKFPKGYVSAAWNWEIESFVLEHKKVNELYTGANLIPIETACINKLSKFVGLKVIDANFKSMEFEYIVDYTMRTEKTREFVELILEFEHGLTFQMAFIDYDVEENKAPGNFSYQLTNALLISVKNRIEIAEN